MTSDNKQEPEYMEIEYIELENGKKYESVASRVRRFHHDKGDSWFIRTELLYADIELVRMRAEAGYYIGEGIACVMGTGHAEEVRNATEINLTSAMENAETSAIGRALAALGYISTESYASGNEVVGARQKAQRINQNRPGALALLQEAAGSGIKALERAWKKDLSEADREACKHDLPGLKRLAKAVDDENTPT